MNPRLCIVSACLLGLNTRYDGTSQLRPELLADRDGDTIYIPLCPEQLGGLSTPRPRAEITAGDGTDVLAGRAAVVDETGRDVTAQFLKGAEQALKIANLCGATMALLKEGSPSCGVEQIRRDGQTIKGVGVTAALLMREGIELKPIK